MRRLSGRVADRRPDGAAQAPFPGGPVGRSVLGPRDRASPYPRPARHLLHGREPGRMCARRRGRRAAVGWTGPGAGRPAKLDRRPGDHLGAGGAGDAGALHERHRTVRPRLVLGLRVQVPVCPGDRAADTRQQPPAGRLPAEHPGTSAAPGRAVPGLGERPEPDAGSGYGRAADRRGRAGESTATTPPAAACDSSIRAACDAAVIVDRIVWTASTGIVTLAPTTNTPAPSR